MHCPACGAPFDGAAACPRCRLDPRGIALFDPKHFVWQAVLCSFVAPAWLTGLNLGRLGDRRRMWLWIVGGAAALLAFLMALVALPDRVAGVVPSSVIGWLVNLPIGLYLSGRQKAVFAAHREAGGLTASVFRGTLIGIGGLVLVFIPTMFLAFAVSPAPAIKGVRLLNAGRCAEAERAFKRALVDRPVDHDSRYNLALSYACQTRTPEAIEEMERYLRVRPDDATAHAWMAMLCDWVGDTERALEHARKADTLDPGILRRLFGEDGDLVP